MQASGNKPARRTARRGARLARPARHTMQLDRDKGRGLSRSRVARTGTGRGACSMRTRACRLALGTKRLALHGDLENIRVGLDGDDRRDRRRALHRVG
eukprot:scaffold23880_cov106-Isochrysis_galbana.AAC.1